MSTQSFAIDCFPESVSRYAGQAVVAIDVIRATTVAVTALAHGRRCLIAEDLEEAQALAATLPNPLLAGELGGDMPAGFHLNNSPADLAARTDVERPLVMLSTSGTALMRGAGRYGSAGYIACLRNYVAVAEHLAGRFDRVAIIGAGSRNEFREEDQMCCAWVGEELVRLGYCPGNNVTAAILERWRGVPAQACTVSNSVAYLRRSGQLRDLDFILAHIGDHHAPCVVRGNEIVAGEIAPPVAVSLEAA